MSDLLRQAFEKATRELPETQQDQIGRWLLDMIEADERRWEAALNQAPEKLEELANAASKEFRADRAVPLDPNKL